MYRFAVQPGMLWFSFIFTDNFEMKSYGVATITNIMISMNIIDTNDNIPPFAGNIVIVISG